MKIALSHPDLFSFVGALSPAIDVAHRPFSLKRIQQSWALRSIFGPWDTDARRATDPFVIVKSVPAAESPYVFLACGEDESLLPPNRAFANLLAKQNLGFEFHVVPGGHDWEQWNRQVPSLFESMLQHVQR